MTAFDELAMVRICIKCGRGFPEWSEYSSIGIDRQPLWSTTQCYEDFCNGRIMEVERRGQIERVKDDS